MEKNLLLSLVLSFGLISIYLYVYFPKERVLEGKKQQNVIVKNNDEYKQEIQDNDKDLEALLLENQNINVIPTKEFRVDSFKNEDPKLADFTLETEKIKLVFTPINAAVKQIQLKNYKDENGNAIDVIFNKNEPVFSTVFNSRNFLHKNIKVLYDHKIFEVEDEKFSSVKIEETHFFNIAQLGYNQFKKKYIQEKRYFKGKFYAVVFRTIIYLKDLSQQIEFFKVFFIKDNENLVDLYYHFSNLSQKDIYFEGNDSVKGLNSSFYTHWGKSLGIYYKKKDKSSYDQVNLSYLNVGLTNDLNEEVIIEDNRFGVTNFKWMSMDSRYLSVFFIPEWDLTNSGRKLWKSTSYFGNFYLGKVELFKYIPFWSFYSRLEENKEEIEIGHSNFYLEKGTYKEFYNTVFFGPKTRLFLDEDAYVSFDFSIIKDRTWLPLIKPIEWAIEFFIFFFYKFFKNYGLCIVFLAIFLKILFHPLTKRTVVSARRMQALSPKLKEIDRIYKNDPQKKQKATMDLYKKEKVNPFSGCLPILIQIPVFYSLWSVLPSLLELKSANFLWIKDLSAPDTILEVNLFLTQNLNLLPLIMVLTSIIQIWLTPQNNLGDKNQSMLIVQYVMSILFVSLFWSTASGLILYWTVQNILQIFQQIYINLKDKILV